MSTDEPTDLEATCGLFAAADILGVSPQRADQLSRQKGFPDPVSGDAPEGNLRRRRRWARSAIEAYAANRKETQP
jgi:hypothetical protein